MLCRPSPSMMSLWRVVTLVASVMTVASMVMVYQAWKSREQFFLPQLRQYLQPDFLPQILSFRNPPQATSQPVLFIPSTQPQPVLSANKPVLSANKPVLSAKQPILSANKPVLSAKQPILSDNQLKPQPSSKPNSALNSTCFSYNGVIGNNTCCAMLPYSAKHMWSCVNATFLQHHPGLSSFGGSSNTGTVWDDGPAVHWALVGDSHLRYIFDVLIRRLDSFQPLQYRRASARHKAGGGWRPARELLSNMRANWFAEDLEVRHPTAPLFLTWYFDPLLTRLPDLSHPWLHNHNRPPVLLIVGTGMWWMKHTAGLFPLLGRSATSVLYHNNLLKVVKPSLVRLAASTSVVFKLLDDVQAADTKPVTTNTYNVPTFDLYNKMATEVMKGTGVVIWDSTLPLSLAYKKECFANPRTHPPMFLWQCKDNQHVGYILVEQYGDMLFNHFCNTHLGLDSHYCRG